jgi:hypothetical protein
MAHTFQMKSRVVTFKQLNAGGRGGADHAQGVHTQAEGPLLSTAGTDISGIAAPGAPLAAGDSDPPAAAPRSRLAASEAQAAEPQAPATVTVASTLAARSSGRY